MKNNISALSSALFFFLASNTGIAQTPSYPKADIVFTHGAIYTVNDAKPWAEAVAVKNNNIIYVGDNKNISQYIDGKTKIVDLQGKMMMPGLHDSHVHPMMGEMLHHHMANVKAYSKEEGLQKLADAAKKSPDNWVVGYGWNSYDSPTFDEITKKDLDKVVPDKMAVVISIDTHGAWLNSKALQHFNITKNTPDPRAGGKIIRDKDHVPTGYLVDSPTMPVFKEIMSKSPYAISQEALLAEAISYLNSLGITSFVDALAISDSSVITYYDLEKQNKLPARVGIAYAVVPEHYREQLLHIAEIRKTFTIDEKVMPRWIKTFGDGNVEDHAAYFLHPYIDDAENYGKHYWTVDQERSMFALANNLGITTYIHVIGDAAVRQTLDSIEAINPKIRLRNVLTHNFFVDPSDLSRYKKLDTIADIQEGWLSPRYSGGPIGFDANVEIAKYIGKERADALSLPFRQLKEAGATLTGGSDWHYTEVNPWKNIYTAMTSKNPDDNTGHTMLPTHTLDLPTLIKMLTINGAYLMYLEKITGSIEVGKRADLIILDRNVFKIPTEQIKNTKVLMTMVDGKQVYPLTKKAVEDPKEMEERDQFSLMH